MTMIRKSLTGAVAALALGATVAATASPAEAGWRGRHHRGNGGAIAAGIIGGLALGALAASAANAAPRRHYYAPAYAEPIYAEPVYNACYKQKQPVYTQWGDFAGYRKVTVCN